MQKSATSAAIPLRPESGITALGEHAPRAKAGLAVMILAFNEEINLPQCLASLGGLKCEVVVVDSGSADRTVEIAREFGAAVQFHPFENYAIQRNWALSNLPYDVPWVLQLDADERLTPELVNEINALMERSEISADGFLLRKRTIFMGRWIRHGGHYPAYHLRLFRHGKGRCEDRLYDQHFLVDGPVERLRHDYMDIVASNLSSWSARHVRWAAMEASEMATTGSKHGQVDPQMLGNPIQRRRWWRNTYGQAPLFLRAFFYWVYRYFFRLGFLDGTEGLIFHFLQGFWFRFLVDSVMFEQRQLSARTTK